jgi:hypothetical protein
MRQAPDSGVPQAENAVQITAVCRRVRRDVLGLQRWAGMGRGGGVPGDEVLDSVA